MAYDIENLSSTPAGYTTPDQLKAIREYSKYLLEGAGQQKVQMPLQGVSNIVSALMGGHMLHGAGEDEKLSKRYEAEGLLPEAPGQLTASKGITPITAPKLPAATGKRAFALPADEAMTALAQGDEAPVVASKGGGSTFGGLPGWAPGEKPVGWDEGDYDSRGSKRMALSAEPGVQAINDALTRGTSSAQGGGGGGIVQPGNYLPSNVTPTRPTYTRDQAMRVLGGFHLPQTERDAVRQGYLGQNQPIPVPVAGGTILAPGTGQGPQSFIPELQKGKVKAGDVETDTFSTVDPTGNTYRYLTPREPPPTGGMLGTPAPTGALPFAAEGEGGAGPTGSKDQTPFPQKLAQATGRPPLAIPGFVGELQKWSQENAIEKARREKENAMHLDVEKNRLEMPTNVEKEKRQELNKTQIDAGEKDFSKIRDIAEVSYRELPTFQLAKRVIEDPTFTSGFAAEPILAVKRALTQMGLSGKMSDPAAMELFKKLTASVNLDNLKTLLGGLGQIRVFEGSLVKDATANIENSPAANRALLHIGMKANQRAIDRADLAAEYRAEHGFLDSNWGKFERNYFKDKPWLPDEDIVHFRKLLEADPRYKPAPGEGGPKTPPARGRRPVAPQQYDVAPPPG